MHASVFFFILYIIITILIIITKKENNEASLKNKILIGTNNLVLWAKT